MGNTRAVLDPNSGISQQTDYYPFGAAFSVENTNKNKYLYGGKELQDETIGSTQPDLYDFGARSYDPRIGRFMKVDRFREKYYSLSPYQYAANNPIRFIDVNGDSIYIHHRNEEILYENGSLYWAKTGKAYDGKALNKKGKLRGFVKHTVNALNTLQKGSAGSELTKTLQDSKDVYSIKLGDNTYNPNTRTVFWNPSDQQPNFSNEDGSSGRSPFIGLAHELGHAWDHNKNGMTYIRNTAVWYTSSEGENIRQSEKIATWWENRVRAEHGEPLRGGYSFDASTTPYRIEPQGRILEPGTRKSSVINIFELPIPSSPVFPSSLSLILRIPYQY